MKKAAVVLALLVFLGVFSHAQEERRGFYFDIGAGWAWIIYPEPFNTQVKNIAKVSGITRLTMDADLSIGYAVLPRLYIVGSVGCIVDSLHASNALYLTTLMLGPGIKFYPLPSMKYLQLGFDAGYTNMYMKISDDPNSISGDGGFGMQISVACDFDSTLTGPALLLGGKFYMGILDGEFLPGFGLFAKFVVKAKRR